MFKVIYYISLFYTIKTGFLGLEKELLSYSKFICKRHQIKLIFHYY